MTVRIKGGVPLTSMGIDPSPAATGIVLLEETGLKIPATLFVAELKPEPGLDGLDRAINVTHQIMEIVHGHKPDRLVVEGFSLNTKNASSIIPLVELGTLIRFSMKMGGLKWYDPRATEVKKFVCGKGTANKEQMMLQVFKRWVFEAATNNVADAYGLACMGLAQAGRLPGITLDMQKIVGAMSVRSK
ncbi:MAG: crossover junction endodeoxyribonuclease RuvC [Aquamicrobium sp.]|uniref:crossover junction endodeoxyribonuclease RuvC n=1 Tax=Aquamicrobium sp. TaxID=1872579 RepID=UPI00349E91E6|nr:crossover junction endodeoxyribonuclease RuvC [Aquamicrobium sp.]